jgi:predicted alpha/beta superfamily hydrolase
MKKITAILILTFYTTLVFGQSKKTKEKESDKPFVLGVTTAVNSKVLGEKRILNIYLPEGYNPKDTTNYPVIYLLDGSADEDFIHIAGLVQYNSFEWINRVPKSIVVGIATVDRRRDFTYPTTIEKDKKAYPTTGGSDKFIAFLETELQPFIQNKYKTNGSKTLIGQSLGGLLATEILFKKPQLFTKYVIVSPSLWWDNGSLLNQTPETIKAVFNQPKQIYIGVGKEGLTSIENPHVMEVDANILADKLKTAKSNTSNVFFDYLPEEDHATIMHQAVLNAFKVIYSNGKVK